MMATTFFVTGFYPPPVERVAGDPPDEAPICARDVNGDAAFIGALHERHQIGLFALWPTLVQALDRLHIVLQQHDLESAEVERAARVCERGALLFLRNVLLSTGVVPAGDSDWPTSIERTCTRFGEAHAAFAHTDLRRSERMYNIWVPIDDVVETEPLLFFHASPRADTEPYCVLQDKAHHLPLALAGEGEWFFFGGMRRGQAAIFPGDGGEDGGVFHASALSSAEPVPAPCFHASAGVSCGSRRSFDVREFATRATQAQTEQQHCKEHVGKGREAAAAAALQQLAEQRAAWEGALTD